MKGAALKARVKGYPFELRLGIDGLVCQINCVRTPLAMLPLWRLSFPTLRYLWFFFCFFPHLLPLCLPSLLLLFLSSPFPPFYPLPFLNSFLSWLFSPSFISSFSQSPRETKAASHVLQTVWSYKDLRNALTKDGWNKSHFQVGPSSTLTPKHVSLDSHNLYLQSLVSSVSACT